VALVLTAGCLGTGDASPVNEVWAEAAVEAVLAAQAGSTERRVLGKRAWAAVERDFEWLDGQLPPCTRSRLIHSSPAVYVYQLECGGQEAAFQVCVNRKGIAAATFWVAHVEPPPLVHQAFEDLAERTRTGELDSTSPIWHPALHSEQLLSELPKLRALGACDIARPWMVNRQAAHYVFDCEEGGAVVRAAVQDDGRISIINVTRSGPGRWAHLAPEWVDPVWFW
jgi:hypothetical protein